MISAAQLKQDLPLRRAVFAHRQALGLITGLIVAVGVALPIVTFTHPLGSVIGVGANARSSNAYAPGAIAGYAGPQEWAQAEGGAYAGFVMPTAKVVKEWAQAEGGYYGGIVMPRPAVVRDWALAEGGAFGSYAYRPGPLAGYAGPEAWVLAEAGPYGSVMTPSPEVVQDCARAEGGYYGVLPSPGAETGPSPSAVAEGGGDGLLTFHHYVNHISTIPAIDGESTQLYVREKVKEKVKGKGKDRKVKDRADLGSTPGRGEVVLMVHGATAPSIPAFDLSYKDYSWMGSLAEAGFDVFAMDLAGS